MIHRLNPFTLLLLSCILIVIYLGSTSFRTSEEEPPSVHFLLYKKILKGENYTTSEDDYFTQMLPGSVSLETRDRIKKAKIKSLESEKLSIRTKYFRLLPEDRVIIYRMLLKVSSTPNGHIYMKKITSKSEEYSKSSSSIIDDLLEDHWGKSYYQSHEVLYDGMPFTFSDKEKDVFGGMLKTLQENFREEINQTDSLEINDAAKKESAKATAIGVRG